MDIEKAPQSMGVSQNDVAALCLSGGGFRAAFFHLGVMTFLQHEKRLAAVRNIVSVSGGSILSIHCARRWDRFVESDDGFREVAAEFIAFTQTNPRNRVVIPWLWSRLLLANWFANSWGKTRRLQNVYNKFYEDTTFESLPENAPNLVVVATDSIRHERVAFTNQQVLRFRFDGKKVDSPFPSTGVRLSLAAAASSCFPPVFSRMRLTHRDLSLSYAEFKDNMFLNDGGVATNLGIQMLFLVLPEELDKSSHVIVSDAERPLTDQPTMNPGADIAATLVALSEAERGALSQYFEMAKVVRFADRLPERSPLAFTTETALHRYRTDLDAPNWIEIHALMLKGALQAAQVFGASESKPELMSEILSMIQGVLKKAGCKDSVVVPVEKDVARCNQLPLRRVIVHGSIVATLLLGEAYGIYRGGVAAYQSLSYWEELQKAYGDFKKHDEQVLARVKECSEMPVGLMKDDCLRRLEEDLREGKELIARVEAVQKRTGILISNEQQGLLNQFSLSARRLMVRNTLKQIGLAISNFYDTRGVLPGEGGEQSWRIDILPYLLKSSEFQKSTTQEVTPQVRHLFQYQGNESLTETNIVAVKGKGTFWDQRKQLVDIDDGTTTLVAAIVVAETGIAINENRDFSVDEAVAAIRRGEVGTLALLADGSVIVIEQQIEESRLRQLLSRTAE